MRTMSREFQYAKNDICTLDRCVGNNGTSSESVFRLDEVSIKLFLITSKLIH